jgi:hypothetical protein
MAKVQHQSNPKVNQIFEDLEKYLDFCVTYGYKFDESTLYDMKNYVFQQFSKFVGHKNFKDQWADDARRFENQVVFQ